MLCVCLASIKIARTKIDPGCPMMYFTPRTAAYAAKRIRRADKAASQPADIHQLLRHTGSTECQIQKINTGSKGCPPFFRYGYFFPSFLHCYPPLFGFMLLKSLQLLQRSATLVMQVTFTTYAFGVNTWVKTMTRIMQATAECLHPYLIQPSFDWIKQS